MTKTDAAKPPERRVSRLFVVRESDTNDNALMEGMVQQTLAEHADLPGVAEALEAGLEPLFNPTRYRGWRPKGDRRRTVLFWMGDEDPSLFLYSQASAAAKGEKEQTNGFCEVLAEAFTTFRPLTAYAATFSRIVRSTNFSGTVKQAAEGNVDRVVCGDGPDIDLRSEHGSMLWDLFGMISDMERQGIVRRMFAGTMVRLLRGEYPRAAISLPVGYMLNEERRVVVDPSLQPVVQRVLEELASPNHNGASVTRILSSHGLTMRAAAGGGRSYSEAGNPSAVSKPFLNNLSLYETGWKTISVKSPLKNVTDYMGHTAVERQPGKPVFEIPQEWGLPPGGWAPPEVIKAAGQIREFRAVGPQRVGGSGRSLRKPLLGFESWCRDGREYALLSRQRFTYFLVSRPEGTGGQWTPKTDRREAAVDARELHESIAVGIATAIGEGVGARRLAAGALGGPHVPLRYDPVAAVEQELAAAERAADAATEAAVAEPDASFRARLLAEARRQDASASAVRARLDDLRTQRHAAIPASTKAEVAVLVKALQYLRATQTFADGQLGQALQDLITEFTLTVDGYIVRWSLKVGVNTADGAMELGPICGSVPDRTSRSTKRRKTITHHAVLQLLRDELSLEEFGQAIAVRDPLVGAALALREQGVHRNARRAILTAAREPKLALASHLSAGAIPHGADQAFVEHIAHVYMSDPRWLPGVPWLGLMQPTEQRLVAVVADAGDGGVRFNDLAALAAEGGLRPDDLRDRIGSDAQALELKRIKRILRFGPAEDRKVHLASKVVTLLRCPRKGCSGRLSVYARVPEVRGWLLCAACLRAPTLPGVVFPSSYRDVAGAVGEAP